MKIQVLRSEKDFTDKLNKANFISFLYKNLDKFGDTKESIENSIDYAFSKDSGKGGFLLAAYFENELVGELVMNNTGMKGYIPENILVYVAVKSDKRGKGYGKKIINKALELINGNVALHVEYENPAKKLYERLGFETKYAEMRLVKGN